MLLSILICRLVSRDDKYQRLRKILDPQMTPDVEVLFLKDAGEVAIGIKRNALMLKASGKYIAFIDDDDYVSSDYISEVMEGIEKDVDCCSLVGEITTNGDDPRMFVHSMDYVEYATRGNVYYRPPNHLNVIKRDLVKSLRFLATNHGEDTDWAMQICRRGILKSEHKIKKTIYFYDFWSQK